MDNFYARLPPIAHFADVSDEARYTAVPASWSVVLSDVCNSTQAIAKGDYKAVNMAGAALIAAARNAYPQFDFPYVFGGDGAMLLIPESMVEAMHPVLQTTQAICQRAYSLSLRVGIVPVSEIVARGAQLKIARYQVSGHMALAMFCGGGVALAEKLVKEEGYKITSSHSAEPDAASLEGLSCRWNPLPARNGQVVALLVVGRDVFNVRLYREVITHIEAVLASAGEQGKPVGVHNLKFRFSPRNLAMEALLGGSRVQIYLRALMAWVMFRFSLRVPAFDPAKYLQDVVLNSDYRKFDDILRMVIDCSDAQLAAITDYLGAREQKGELTFGYHTSGHAVMTCFVQSHASDGHVHFVDGGEGGYAIAAQMLKAKQQAAAA